ncbi:DUF2069 domain-containing protein [Rhodoferax sp.]|jgi:uncharacterized membrane protein|uniref:DUF2069 domain-containing protein n=1 Tax=Rhodoferax sp. TaxID=50421 RepID=UPI0037847E26
MPDDFPPSPSASAPGFPSDSAPSSPAPTPTTVAITRWLAVGSVLGLIVLGLAWELVISPLRPGGSWWALKVLPLCFPLAGLLKNRMYTYRWVSLVVWLYFIEGVVRAWSDKPPSNYLAMVEVLLCLSLFTACALHVHLRFKYAAIATKSAGTPGSTVADTPAAT